MSLKLDMTCEVRVCAACICERLATSEDLTLHYAMYDSERSFFMTRFKTALASKS